MTPEEIRAEYVELLARTQRTMDLTQDLPIRLRPDWYGITDRMKDEYRRYVTPMVDALAEAGLLPTSVEGRYIGCGMLRRTRLVTDWKEPEQ